MTKQSKGGAFEREFSKLLSLYVTEGTRTDVFWRSSQSGGRATQRAKQNLTTAGSYGDITCLDSDFAFITETCCFELKRGYNGTNIQELIDGNKKEPELLQFWKQCERDRILGDRLFSIVVFKRDRKRAIITIPRKLHYLIAKDIGSRLYNRIDISFGEMLVTSIPLEEFMERVPSSVFLKILKMQQRVNNRIKHHYRFVNT